MKNKITIEKSVIVVKLSDGTVRQVLAPDEIMEALMHVLTGMQDGKVKVSETELQGVEFI